MPPTTTTLPTAAEAALGTEAAAASDGGAERAAGAAERTPWEGMGSEAAWLKGYGAGIEKKLMPKEEEYLRDLKAWQKGYDEGYANAIEDIEKQKQQETTP